VRRAAAAQTCDRTPCSKPSCLRERRIALYVAVRSLCKVAAIGAGPAAHGGAASLLLATRLSNPSSAAHSCPNSVASGSRWLVACQTAHAGPDTATGWLRLRALLALLVADGETPLLPR